MNSQKFQQHEFSYTAINDDIDRLAASLGDALDLAGLRLHPPQLKKVRILNLACGRADETGILLKVLAPCAEAAEMIGIDVRHREIMEASQRWQSTEGVSSSFLVHDATKLDAIKEIGSGFDYAFMRHQNFWNGDLTWHKIYDQALHLLKPSGLLIITSYFDREHLLALKAIQSLGAKLKLSWQNPRTRKLSDAPNKSTDRHIAIFQLP